MRDSGATRVGCSADPESGFQAAGSSDRVMLGRAVSARGPPVGRYPALLFQPQQCRIERALIQMKRVLRNLLDTLSDAISMLPAERVQRLQHHQVESSLQDVRF